MQTHITCECGYNVEVSSEQPDDERRCPRCGRRLSLDDFPQHLLNDDIPYPVPAGGGGQVGLPVRGATSSPESDPDATMIHTGTKNVSGVGSGVPTIPSLSDDFEVNDPHVEDSDVAPSPNPESPGGSSHARFDLSQRVMRPIAKPIVPVIPYSGTGEYGIHRVLRVHQRGGMGRILVAYDQYLKREVALKELHSDVAEDDSIVRRFIGEAEITAQLEHPGVVPIHRIGQGTDGLPYYTMKMIKGDTLQDAIKAYHRKPVRAELLNLVRRLVSVSKTIAFAHSKGVIHRDLKPANVMLGEHSETLVMDWGLAKPYNQVTEESYVSIIHRTKQPRPELTMVGAIVGTPAFMSPEQANAEENVVGPLSDVFSLGTVLYYMLAGQTAFSGRSTQEVLSKVRACNPIPPSHIKPNVPGGLEAICLRAMAKLPEDRYQGATEFADDLCRWLDDEPVVAEADSIFAKIRRWFSHYRVPLLGTACVFILSLVLTILSVWIIERYHNIPHATEKVQSEFGKNVLIQGSLGIEVWTTHQNTEGLSLTCQVKATESDKHHSLSVGAPAGVLWDLSGRDFLEFSLLKIQSAENPPVQNFAVRLSDGEAYHEYKLHKESWEIRNQTGWNYFEIPLQKDHDSWNRETQGKPELTKIKQIEIHFDADSEMILIFDTIKFRTE